jgi:hypothetical protein
VYDAYYAQLGPAATAFTSPRRLSAQASNPDASSYNNLQEQFIGDYIGIFAGPTSAVAVGPMHAMPRPARRLTTAAGLSTGGRKGPSPPTRTPPALRDFGNTNTFGAVVDY